MLAAAIRWFDSVPDALTAEAMAAKEGMKLAVECGLGRIILEVESVDGLRSLIGGLCFKSQS